MRALAVLLLLATTAEASLVDGVDPFIGTGGHGHTYPGASLPFGLVQLSPDTRLTGWDGCSGYHFTDTAVFGFSHTHLSGTGVSDYGDILFMPRSGDGPVPRENGYPDTPDRGYGSRFSKASERAEAGYYAVHLDEYGVDVELTTTLRTGWHRWGFPRGVDGHLVIDLTHRDETLDAMLRVVDAHTVEGYRVSRAWAQEQHVYFRAEFSEPFLTDVTEIRGPDVKGVLHFGPGGPQVVARVGISAVDLAGAQMNLALESAAFDWEFDAVRAAAKDAWRAELDKVRVTGLEEEHRTILATALYHSFLAPNTFSDKDGRYRGMDMAIHDAGERTHYTVFSLWDTFRATHPLFTLLQPDRVPEMVETMLAQYDQYGRLPVWELAANETNCMIGYHSVSVIADAWAKGLRGFDGDRALDAMVATADADLFGLTTYDAQGFLGQEDESESVSKTLEYAYNDWCIAVMADALGRDDVASRFGRRSQAWRHLLDPETGFFRPRSNQQWSSPFDPYRVDINFTEANAWQYRFFVPHDVEGLIAALGGDEAFLRELEGLFTTDSATTGRDQVDITGLIGQYAHGNEPSHHMAWLYHYVGRPDLSARRVREILTTLYRAVPDGLSGNEDCGQMSSWYVLASLGLYPVSPGRDDYLLGVPLMESAGLELAGGPFTIRREGPADGVVVGARLDGVDHPRSWIRHGELLAGSELVIRTAATPDDWGGAQEHRPPSAGFGPAVLPAPYVVSGERVFRGAQEVAFASADGDVRWRFNDGDRWTPAAGPVAIAESRTFQLQAVREGAVSPVVRARFHRIPHDWSMEWHTDPRPSYVADGPRTLVDGLRGDADWRKGGWVGYQDADFVTTVDFGETLRLERVGGSFLQDARSWIWMPVSVSFAASTDGETWQDLGSVGHDVDDRAFGTFLRELWVEAKGAEARFLRIDARNIGPIGEWHPGHGGMGFIFVDEVLVDVADR